MSLKGESRHNATLDKQLALREAIWLLQELRVAVPERWNADRLARYDEVIDILRVILAEKIARTQQRMRARVKKRKAATRAAEP